MEEAEGENVFTFTRAELVSSRARGAVETRSRKTGTQLLVEGSLVCLPVQLSSVPPTGTPQSQLRLISPCTLFLNKPEPEN